MEAPAGLPYPAPTMNLRWLVLLALLLAFPAPLRASALDSLVRRYPADSLGEPLRAFESAHGRERVGAEAALLLGRFHYARGEYRPAAEAFARAAARLDPSQKPEARYWTGLARLGMREHAQARALLEEVASTESPRRAGAMLGVALAWEQAGRPDRAFDTLENLLAGEPGEAGPGALEHLILLAVRLHRPDAGEKARARLVREYPNSIEAARSAAPAPAAAAKASTAIPAATGPRPTEVLVGAFATSARAGTLEAAAKRAGFTSARVVANGEGAARTYVVRLGVYPSRDEARKAGEQAERKLGVAVRLAERP